VAARLGRVVEQGLTKIDLTPSQYRILMFLADGSAQASMMADHLAVSRPSVTAVVDGLVGRGLVDRRHDELDRRRVRHSITTEGERLLGEADAALADTLDAVLTHAPNPEARLAALEGLAAWSQAMDGYRAACKAAKVRQADMETVG
jgi:long-chain acyl-CoA synthetase